MKMMPLGSISVVELSNIDKKTKAGEKVVTLCNFVDVYHNWQITREIANSFMEASANSKQIERFRLHKGQVAITKDSETRDDIGVATYIADDLQDAVLGYHCALITPDESILTGEYLNIIMHSPYAQKYFEANASGSGQRYTLTKEIIESMPVPVPDMAVQEKAGKVLSDIDRKIAINKSICSDLEAMIKLIFQYWFVQFDFPDENGNPYKSSGGNLVWNEAIKRYLPEGWVDCTIGDITSRVKVGFVGTVDKFYCEKEEGIPIIRPAEMGEEGIDYTSLRYITRDFYEKNKKSQVKNGNIIISRCGKDGIPNIYDLDTESQVLNAVIIEQDRDIVDEFFIYETLKTDYSQKQITNGTSGSVQGVINTEMIAKISLVFNKKVARQYCDKYRWLYEYIFATRRENRELSEVRDFLIPLLINEQVCVV